MVFYSPQNPDHRSSLNGSSCSEGLLMSEPDCSAWDLNAPPFHLCNSKDVTALLIQKKCIPLFSNLGKPLRSNANRYDFGCVLPSKE